MKQTNKFLLGLALLTMGLNTSIFAQGSWSFGQLTIGDNPTLLYGDITNVASGELFLGNHTPRLQQTNTLYIVGSYTGDPGSKNYHSVINNTNTSGTRGFLDIVGNATGNTEIVLDMFSGWDGTCIDLARAYNSGSDIDAFIMQEGDYNGHHAYLKSRVEGGDRIWFLAERMIIGEYLSPQGQNRCIGSNNPFDPLTVVTPSNGNYLYQWYKKSGAPADSRDFSNAAPVGSANGGQTATYTPVINTDTTFYYFCVVRNANCSAFNVDTTDVSGAITIDGIPDIHIIGTNMCIGNDTAFIAEAYIGNKRYILPEAGSTYFWHISEGLAATIDSLTGIVTAHSTGTFQVCLHYTTPGGCTLVVSSADEGQDGHNKPYIVFAKPVSEVQDIVLCSPQIIPASSLIKNLINADTYKIYESDGVTEITGQNIQATTGTAIYLVEAINTDCHCVAERVAVRVTVTDNITFDLAQSSVILCEGSESLIDLASYVENVNVSDYRIEVYTASGSLLPGTIVGASEQMYYVKVISGNCSSAGIGISVKSGSNNLKILTQPTVQSYSTDELDDYVNFYVVAEGATSYQWYKLEYGVSTPISGETGSVLSIQAAEIDANPNTSYYVVVTGGCASKLVSIKSDVVYAGACRPLIIQKKNHTLIVDNNRSNNGGYNFVYYEWYRNNELIHKGAYGNKDLGGMYNTGGSNLNTADVYYAILTDETGKKHRTCTYNPVNYISNTRIVAYPNPTTTASSLVVVDVETNDEELLANGVITAYNSAGQYLGQYRTEGHRVTPVQLPSVAAVYILKFTSGEYEKEIKIIVQ
ncbi:MAG: T9SS type A sorting domain-containing protein [Prevotellaceae bacterium]|jgi:hypothetical protein|nr:T9SS type A sorting domain-containing protein [Prevotellaceae bacterium]